jgi:hypothetical protein
MSSALLLTFRLQPFHTDVEDLYSCDPLWICNIFLGSEQETQELPHLWFLAENEFFKLFQRYSSSPT